MYKQFRSGIKDVTDTVYTRSLSNLSLLNDSQPDVIDKDEEGSHVKQEVVNAVKECWEIIEDQSYHHDNAKFKVINKNGWQTVRIFVSSTFTDFYCEREILVKKVFPELREWCRHRQLYLIDCDLRWGVPKDTPTSETISMCMEELDRCLEETQGQPFFLNILGERYGWIPGDNDIPNDMKEKYSWVPNTSITSMEIIHGAYRVSSQNALFMFRNSDIVNQVSEERLPRFKDTDDLSQYHLKEMKKKVETKFPQQVYKYNCQVDGMITLQNKQKVNIVDLDDFANQVLTFFKAAVVKHFPGRVEEKILPTILPVLEETELQQKTMEEMANSCLGRKKEGELLLSFLKGETENFQSGDTKVPFSRDVEFWGEEMLTGNRLLCVCSPPGYGKSTLLAWIAQQSINNGTLVFFHFCGNTCNSHDVMLLLKRFITFLSKDTSKESLVAMDNLSENELKSKLKSLLLELQKSDNARPMIVILDSFNQLSTNDRVHHLSWLPPLFPPNVRCIVSTTAHPPTVSRVKEHPHYWFNLQKLNREDARNIIQLFLRQFNKILDEDQLRSIASSECSESPLWLYLVCEELRIYGDFGTLTKHIEKVTVSVDGILTAIISRLLKEDDTGCMEQALCLVACSVGTLTALDLQRLLGNIEKKEPLPTYLWMKIRRNLQAYLRVVHYNEQISFSHNLIKEAVRKLVIKSRSDEARCHRLLADYVEYWCEDWTMKVNYLPTYLELANLKERIINFLRTVPASTHISPWKRSNLIHRCRCTSLADPVIGKVSPVQICVFCKSKRACWYPNSVFFNKDMCIVCGNHVHPGPFSVDAHLCPFHTPAGGFGPKTCFLCKNVIVKSPVPGKLCNQCGFGNRGKQCSALSLK